MNKYVQFFYGVLFLAGFGVLLTHSYVAYELYQQHKSIELRKDALMKVPFAEIDVLLKKQNVQKRLRSYDSAYADCIRRCREKKSLILRKKVNGGKLLVAELQQLNAQC